MLEKTIQERLRALPAVHELLKHPIFIELKKSHSESSITAFVRESLESLRRSILSGEEKTLPPEDIEWFTRYVYHTFQMQHERKLVEVINATGIVLHTNLGRAPLHKPSEWHSLGEDPKYMNIEMDLQTGKRSNRQKPIRDVLVKLTGCESATVVNNCAAATIISLRALAKDKEVIVSRGQLVEIGGSFRIPDILEVSGAKLREVGTTNMTRIADYEKAINPQTALLMRIHQSNFRIRGHTASPSLEEFVSLSKKHNIPFVDDVGSGAMVPLERFGLTDEPLVMDSVKAGADAVLFSGDKLLGGPQSGLILGKKQIIERIESDPLMRAFRCNKTTLASLESILLLYLSGRPVEKVIPIYCMLAQTPAELRQRCEKLVRHKKWQDLTDVVEFEIIDEVAYVGGGTLPDQTLPTVVIAIGPKTMTAEDLARQLRDAGTPIITRVKCERVLIDLRAVKADSEDSLLNGLMYIFREFRWSD